MRNKQRAAEVAKDPNDASRYLHYWLLLALFFEYARPASFVGPLEALHLNSIIPLGLLLFCLFSKDTRSRQQIFADPLAKWIFIFFALMASSILHAKVSFYSYNTSTLVLGYVFLFFIIARVATTYDRIRGVFAVLIFAHIFLLIMNPDAILNTGERNYIKGGSFLGDGNDFALSVCILIPMAVELALASQSKLKRLMWWGVLGLLAFAIIGSSSRGGTLGLAAVAGYIWWRSPRKALTAVLICAVVLILLVFASDLYFERMGTLSNYEEDGSAMGRIVAWTAAVQMFLDHPILGVGAGNFPSAFGTEYQQPGNTLWRTAHSMYFLILGELALPGIIILLILVFGNMRASRKVEYLAKVARGKEGSSVFGGEGERMLYLLNASLLGYAVAGAFLSVPYYPHIFVLTGLTLSARRLAGAHVKTGKTRKRFVVRPEPEVFAPSVRKAAAARPSRRPAIGALQHKNVSK